MRSFLFLFACLIGSSTACFLGLVTAINWNTSLIAAVSAALLPTVAVYIAGLRARSQLAKIAAYALLGWALCFVLAPSTSQTRESRARRNAADPFQGKSWLLSCAATSWLFASVGIVFAPPEKSPDE